VLLEKTASVFLPPNSIRHVWNSLLQSHGWFFSFLIPNLHTTGLPAAKQASRNSEMRRVDFDFLFSFIYGSKITVLRSSYGVVALDAWIWHVGCGASKGWRCTIYPLLLLSSLRSNALALLILLAGDG